MYSLERIFVTCLVLFGGVILCMFALFFDLGDIFSGWLHRDEPFATGAGQAQHMVEEAERMGAAQQHEVTPGPVGHGACPSMAQDSAAAHAGVGAPLDGSDRAELTRMQLKARGYTNEDYIEMRALGEDRDDVLRALARSSELADQKAYRDALGVLDDAIASTNPRNLMGLRDLLAQKVSIALDGRDVEKAKQAAIKLTELLERIAALNGVAQSQGKEDLSAQLASIRAQRDRLDAAFQDMDRRMKETGDPGGFTPTEKTQVRDSLKKARQEGRITEDEYQRVLKEVGS